MHLSSHIIHIMYKLMYRDRAYTGKFFAVSLYRTCVSCTTLHDFLSVF